MFTVKKVLLIYLSTYSLDLPAKRSPNLFVYFEGYEEVLNIYYAKWQREYREYVRGDLIKIGINYKLADSETQILRELWVNAFSMYNMRLLFKVSIFH